MKRALLPLLLLGAACTTGEPGTPAGQAVRIVAINVGQGDSILVIGPDGSVLLMDGGDLGHGEEVRAAIEEEAGGRVDHIVLSHWHQDHMGGLVEFLLGPDRIAHTQDDGAPDAQLWDRGDDGSCSNATCNRYRGLRSGRVNEIQPGDVIALGQAELTCMAVNGDVADGSHVTTSDENSRSVALLLRYGSFQAFMAGDLTGGGDGTGDVETAVAQLTGHVDVLKAGHHGSKTSTNANALAKWTPRVTLISEGTDNSYCHPTQSVVDRLEAAGTRIFATGDGMVHADGSCMPTRWPEDSMQLGTIHVEAFGDASMTVEGESIP